MRGVGQLAEGRRGVAIVFVLALAAWWIEAAVIPLGPGRDLGTYLGAYAQLFQSHPVDLGYVLGRTPIAPLVVGGLLDLAGGLFAEPVMSLLFAASVAAWFVAARTFNRAAAILIAVVLLLYPGYAILFHELSSDAVFAAAFAGWSLLAVRAFIAPTPARFALVGLGVGVLALVRPGNQALLVLAALAFVAHATWRRRVVSAVAFAVPALVLIGAWTLNNGLRYDNYTFARGGNATVPFYRAYVTDHIVRPSNGPASRELARAVAHDLLPKQPYKAYGITLKDFFEKASPRMQVDLLALSDRVKGWHSNHVWLRDVGMEAVRTHTTTYARGVAGTTWELLTQALYRSPLEATPAPAGSTATTQSVNVGDRTLPAPSEGEPIPAPHEGGVTTPDDSIYTVWTSPTAHHLVFVHRGQQRAYDRLHARMNALGSNLPTRAGNASLAQRLNQASKWYFPPILWLVLGVVGLLLRRPRDALALVTPTIAGLVVVVFSALGIPAEPHYSVPVAPAFIVLAGGALFAPRRLAWREDARRALTAFASGVAFVAGVWALLAYATRLKDAVTGGAAPFDFAVFLHAAGQVVHGHSPYAFNGDATYAYPPLLAYVVVPLHAIGASAATVVWMLLSLAAIGVALWLLGLRDWRCYALAAFFRFTRSSVDLGTIEPLLLLAVAVAWRRRDNVYGAVATGAGIALKLFVWPVAAWFAATRRFVAPAVAVGTAVVLVLIPWAALGFAGLTGFPHLLRRLSHDEASSSYSIVALAVRAHLPASVGYVIAALAAIGFLAAAWRIGRHNEAVALSLAVAAALAASPILWIHYFLLLLAPLALLRPRLTPVWFVPLAYSFLSETAWPGGDTGKLALALVTTLAVLIGTTVKAA